MRITKAKAITPQPDKREINMPHYEVITDTETADRAGASGTFQVVEINDENGNDVTEELGIDAGTHYRSEDELVKDIAASLGVPADEVTLDIE